MLKKNNIAETAFLSSCLATKGHNIQLMITAATTPTTNARPRLIVIVTGDPLSVIKESDITVNDRHPTSPDLCSFVSYCPTKVRSSCLSYRMGALSESIEHRQEVDSCKHSHDVRAALPCGITSSSPDSTEHTHRGPGD